MYMVIIYSFILVLNFRTLCGSRETEENRKEKSDSSSEREIFESAIFFTTRTTALTTTTEVYFNSNAPAGSLYNFIVNICKIIINHFSNSRVPKYFEILSRSLRHLGSGFLMRKVVRRFSKKLYKLSAFRGELLKGKVSKFLQIITEDKPKRHELFSALNSIITSSLDRKMDDYVYQLKKYGTRRVKHIDAWTRKVFDYVIFYTIRKQTEVVKGDILLKFKLAVIEYMEGKVLNNTSGF